MKILMVCPYSGGIDVYVNALAKEIRETGHVVDVMGSISGESAYDVDKKAWKSSEEVVKMVNDIKNRIPFGNYDVVAFHYGKNDIEMLIPPLIDKSIYPNTKFVYFVHFLSRNLFEQYIPDPVIQKEIENAVFNFFDGYLFFGNFAKKFMENQTNKTLNGLVSFLPETHSMEFADDEEKLIYKLIPDFEAIANRSIILPGFAANYKDHKLLLEAFRYVSHSMVYIFAGPGWRKRIPEDSKIGNVEVKVIDKYLTPLEYKVVTINSLFGVFPYRQPNEKGEFFQGSGTIPNFIYSGKATIGLDDGAIPEYIDGSGIIVPKDNPIKLAKAIDDLFDIRIRSSFEEKAKARADLFSLRHHAMDTLRLFNSLLSL